MPKTKTTTNKTKELHEASFTVIDPLERLRVLFFTFATLLIAAFRSTTIFLFIATLVIIAVLYLFFSLFGLT